MIMLQGEISHLKFSLEDTFSVFYITLYFRPDWMAIDLDFANNLWLPNIFIYDLKEFKVNIDKHNNE